MWLSDANYVAAAGRAGGLGFITPRSFPDAAAFRDELAKCADLSEGKPFGVNLYISGRPGENGSLPEWIENSLAAGVRFFESAGGPVGAVMSQLAGTGARIIHKVTTIRHALAAERAGVDVISLVGAECGGHPGGNENSALVLGALAKRALSVPFVLGGGIGTGSQLAAALALGADGVVLGTRMTVADEIWSSRAYKERIVACDEASTMTVLGSINKTMRVMRNETAESVRSIEDAGGDILTDGRDMIRGAILKGAYESGEWQNGLSSLGPSACFANSTASVAEIFDEITVDAISSIGRLSALEVSAAGSS